MAYQSTTIKQAVLGIANNELLLPVIQREMVWDAKKIETLFDSVLSGYPFGSMLFWKYRIESAKSYKFYEFIKCYDEYNKKQNHNNEHGLAGKEGDEITAVLDGQQRLTALYIGLNGYMNLCKPRIWQKYRELAENYDKKFLFIDLLYSKDSDETDAESDVKPEYNFKFKTVNEVRDENSNKHLWFRVGKILDFQEDFDWEEELLKQEIPTDNLSKSQEKQVSRILQKLWLNICSPSNAGINYFEETGASFDRVLNIFVRINQGGEPLSYTDFLMSMLVNQWVEGREAINDAIDSINSDYKFNIPKDIFLRCCLYLTDSPVHFKAENFKKHNVEKIHSEFDSIIQNLRLSCEYFNKIGYTKDNLKSNLILLPLALYFNKSNKTKLSDYTELEKVKRWIQISVLCGAYGGQTNTYLESLRNTIDWSKQFPLQEILDRTKSRGYNIVFDKERLEEIVGKARYGSQDTFTLLSILYPNKNYSDTPFHEDHIYPKSKLSKEQLSYGGNYIANLQLLDGIVNEEKLATMPDEWLAKRFDKNQVKINEYKKANYIPINYSLTMENFDEFLEERKARIVEALLHHLR